VCICDEHTSALDGEAQTRVLQLLAGSGMTIVSVSHRVELRRYHTHVLEIMDGGAWRLFEQHAQ
jgi:putative ATP-binding cassette transporter